MRFNPDDYVTVAERVEKFYAKFPEGRLLTAIVEHDAETGFVLVRAEAYRQKDDALPSSTGHAYELRSAGHVQQGSYVEVCETSAVGRALALLGFETTRGIASREEVVRSQAKAEYTGHGAPPQQPPPPQNAQAQSMADLVTPKQLGMIRALAREAGVDADEECILVYQIRTEELSKRAASGFIDHLKGLPKNLTEETIF
jgi:hypothetical protein